VRQFVEQGEISRRQWAAKLEEATAQHLPPVLRPRSTHDVCERSGSPEILSPEPTSDRVASTQQMEAYSAAHDHAPDGSASRKWAKTVHAGADAVKTDVKSVSDATESVDSEQELHEEQAIACFKNQGAGGALISPVVSKCMGAESAQEKDGEYKGKDAQIHPRATEQGMRLAGITETGDATQRPAQDAQIESNLQENCEDAAAETERAGDRDGATKQQVQSADVQRKVHTNCRAEAALKRMAESIKAEALDYRDSTALAHLAKRRASASPRGEVVGKHGGETLSQEPHEEAQDGAEEMAQQCLSRLAQPTLAAQARVDKSLESSMVDPDAPDWQEQPPPVTHGIEWSRRTTEAKSKETSEPREHRNGMSTPRQSPPWVEWPVARAQIPAANNALSGSDDDHDLQRAFSSVASAPSATQISARSLTPAEGVMRADDAMKTGQQGGLPTPMQASLLAFHDLRSQLLENVVNSKRIMRALRGDDSTPASRGLRARELVNEDAGARFLARPPAQDHGYNVEEPSMVAEEAVPVGKGSANARADDRPDCQTDCLSLETIPSSSPIVASPRSSPLPSASPRSGMRKAQRSMSKPDLSLIMHPIVASDKGAQLPAKASAQDHGYNVEEPSMVAEEAVPVGKENANARADDRPESSSPIVASPRSSPLPSASPRSGMRKIQGSMSKPDLSLIMQSLPAPADEPERETEREFIDNQVTEGRPGEEVVFDSATLSGLQEDEEVNSMQHVDWDTLGAADGGRGSNDTGVREPTLAQLNNWLNLASEKLHEFCEQLPHVVTPAHLLRPRKLRPEIKSLLQQCSGLDPSQ